MRNFKPLSTQEIEYLIKICDKSLERELRRQEIASVSTYVKEIKPELVTFGEDNYSDMSPVELEF